MANLLPACTKPRTLGDILKKRKTKLQEKEILNNIIEILVPTVFYESQNGIKKVLDISIENPQEILDVEILRNGFYGLKNYENPKFSILILLDSLTEGYLSKFNPEEIDILWGTLSVILNCRNIEHLRTKLTEEIYENHSIKYTYFNSSKIFNETEYIVANIKYMEFNAITILTEKEFINLTEEFKKLEIEIVEMNQNVA